MKNTYILVLLLMVTIALCSCRKSSTEESNTLPGSEASVLPTASTALPSNWDSFQFELNGKLYQLPAAFKEFADEGWRREEDTEWMDQKELTDSVSPDSIERLYLGYGEYASMLVSLINLTENTLELQECQVVGIEFVDYFGYRLNDDKRVELILPGGITFGSSMDDVRKAYGDPSDTLGTIWEYSKKYHARVEITFDSQNNTAGMLMENIFVSVY